MEEKKKIPVVPLRGLVILPEMILHFDVSRGKSIRAVESALEENQQIFLVAQKEANVETPNKEDIYEVGCLATVKQIVKIQKGMLRVLVAGEQKARILQMEDADDFIKGEVEPLEIVAAPEDAVDLPALRSLKELFGEYTRMHGKLPREVLSGVREATNVTTLMAEVAANMPLDYRKLQLVLEEKDEAQSCEILSVLVANEIEVIRLRNTIQSRVKDEMDRHQKEYILREQMKVIREELGEDTVQTEAQEFEESLEKLDASDEVKEKIQKEIKRLKNTMNSPAESGVIRTYIETMLEMPWNKACEENQDIAYAKEILEAEHYGLEQVKERILEFLAVRVLTQKGQSPILCLAGPPGTGKTSIAKSLAKALKKPYRRIALGGVRDEAEIRGHRRTYVGAMPGRIANAVKASGVKNPLILLDEIDKVSNDYKGDTFSALLEVLDSEQNNKFRDHYLEVPLDLSEVLFVTTANDLQKIPRPLLDRMEIIEISSYTENEKFHIASEHLLPKQLMRNGLTKEQLRISKKALWKMTRNYTKEAGVRQLERTIGEICRKSAKEILETKKQSVQVTEANLERYLGKEKYSYQMANEADEVGVVRGLAWTSVGGDTLQIEVNTMPGKGEILLTGQLGDVMKESARTGLSYIRSVSSKLGIMDDFYERHDIHIHIPEGAVPKDGPSAGITMATAMISAFTGRKIRADLAMTGEITLRGRVLPIGGLKEKLLAAKSAGIHTVLVPDKNRADVMEIAKEITRGLEIVPVSHMDEVLSRAFADGE